MAEDLRATSAEEAAQRQAFAASLFSWLVFVAGAALLVYAFLMDTRAPGVVIGAEYVPAGTVENLGRLFRQLVTSVAGAGLIITGAVFITRPRR